MTGYEFTPFPEKVPPTEPAFSGGPPQPPPKPPKLTALELFEPGEPGKRVFVSEDIEVRALAGQLGVKPFHVVADLLKLRVFKHAHERIDLATAAAVAMRRGFIVERVLPEERF